MQNEIIEKIKKLLRNKGRSAEETATALALAQKLASKHGIDIEQVNPDDPEREPIEHEKAIKIKRFQYECKCVALILNNFFNVRAIQGWDGWTFVGTKTNIEIAKYIYTFLVRHFRREWETKRGRLRNRQCFMEGMYIGLFRKLSEGLPEPDQQEGLILISHSLQLEDYIKNAFGKLKEEKIKPDGDSDKARARGYVCGRKTNIHKGVNTTDQETKLICG